MPRDVPRRVRERASLVANERFGAHFPTTRLDARRAYGRVQIVEMIGAAVSHADHDAPA